MKQGYISQVVGPVVDIRFPDITGKEQLPAIHEALVVDKDNGNHLIVEVQQHIGESTVRTVAMDSTDGLRRGMPVKAMGAPISMPVGDQIKGRLMNVVGE
jgi:F-type H+-transporting ATPase subunit beta